VSDQEKDEKFEAWWATIAREYTDVRSAAKAGAKRAWQAREAEIASLQAQLRTARNTLEQYQTQARRRYRDDADYLDYEDDRR